MQSLCFTLFILFFFGCTVNIRAQTITNEDGTPFSTQYCWEDTDFPLKGTPVGGSFSGCGVFQQNGQWYFNPLTATQGLSVFPVQCNLIYTVNGTVKSLPILIWKPVVISPPLKDTFTCNGEIYLHATTLYAGAYNYGWLPSAPLAHADSSNTEGYITASETFVVTAVDASSGCVGRDTLTVEKFPAPHIIASQDTTIRARGTVQLHATGAAQYSWQPGLWLNDDSIANPVARPHAPITYTVTGENENGCTDTAEVTINISQAILIPNAFSPNGDGLNDIFRIENFGYQKVDLFSVFNRWGQRVFQTLDGAKGWDGAQNGKPADAGTYYYHIRLETGTGTKDFRGEVSLIR